MLKPNDATNRCASVSFDANTSNNPVGGENPKPNKTDFNHLVPIGHSLADDKEKRWPRGLIQMHG